MTEEKKPKRKYTRRPKVEPMAVYAVMVTVRRGRKSETIYGESTRVENGCLVVVSMDGPPPLVEKVRYIPLGSAEIDVCQRPQPVYRQMPTTREQWEESGLLVARASGPVVAGDFVQRAGPQIQPGPLELARMREAQGFRPVQRPQASNMVERNADGIPVVTAGFLDGSPT